VTVRRFARRAASTLLFALMFAGCLGMWFGLPVAWLFAAGRLKGLTGSLGAAVVVGLLGMVVSVVVATWALRWLAEKHAHAREARGLQDLGLVPLEGAMVVSAVLAVGGFAVWFLFLAGAEPIPLGLPK
jgi:bacteriorhodopsin